MQAISFFVFALLRWTVVSSLVSTKAPVVVDKSRLASSNLNPTPYWCRSESVTHRSISHGLSSSSFSPSSPSFHSIFNENQGLLGSSGSLIWVSRIVPSHHLPVTSVSQDLNASPGAHLSFRAWRKLLDRTKKSGWSELYQLIVKQCRHLGQVLPTWLRSVSFSSPWTEQSSPASGCSVRRKCTGKSAWPCLGGKSGKTCSSLTSWHSTTEELRRGISPQSNSACFCDTKCLCPCRTYTTLSPS
mmetsp:Transcript_19586/g.38813  ORF Transcript_19586/g.38813 Transcript_19586/m.38813 type:complete len:244 (+) Transcript_19586:414-1145(+)